MASRRSLLRPILLVAPLLGLAGCALDEPTAHPSVLLVTVDTLRADYLHSYGFPLETTPHIDALAERGVVFERAIAAATLTAPAHASIMTGLYARQHSIGVRNGDTRLEGVTTLAEQFLAAGYETAAFVSNVVLRRRTGLDRGFESYDDELVRGEINRKAYFERNAADTGRLALQWLGERSERPFFLWVHLQDPHGPYTPPDEWRGRVGEHPLRVTRPLKLLSDNIGPTGIPAYQALGEERLPAVYAARYAEEIMYADVWVGKVVAAAEQASGEYGLVTLFTADHGESMGERGWFFQHGQSTTPDLARVPFIVSAPDVEPGRLADLVSHVDVAPTLLELAGVPAIAQSSGTSLAGLVRTREALPERTLYCDTDGEAGAYQGSRFTRVGGSIASDRMTDVVRPLQVESLRIIEGGVWQSDDVDVVAREALLRYIEARAPLVAADQMEPEHIERLRALGYLPPDGAANEPTPAPNAD
jgi:arylsulfatase A-like enzyme